MLHSPPPLPLLRYNFDALCSPLLTCAGVGAGGERRAKPGAGLGQAWGRPGASLLGQPTPSERRGGKINRFRKFPNLSVRVRQLALAPGWVGPSPRRSVADRESPPDGGELALLWPEAVRVGRHDSNNSTYPRKSFRRRLDEISKPISKQQGSY